jgi:hypothetical protein
MNAKGPWTHAPSGLVFPAGAKGWMRVALDRYDAEGNDVGVGYKTMWLTDKGAVWSDATIFVYPALLGPDGKETPLAEQFEGEVNEVRKAHDEVREIRRGVTEASYGARAVQVKFAEFSFRLEIRGAPMDAGSCVVAFRSPPWHVTYRLTYPRQHRERFVAAFERLLSALGLPASGLPAAPPK